MRFLIYYFAFTLVGLLVLTASRASVRFPASIYVKPGVIINKLDKIDKFLLKYDTMDIVITSGYRDIDRNKSVGGSEKSLHQVPGQARDIRLIAPYDSILPKLLRESGFRVIIEEDHIHIDTKGLK